jgi:hypothetical protein
VLCGVALLCVVTLCAFVVLSVVVYDAFCGHCADVACAVQYVAVVGDWLTRCMCAVLTVLFVRYDCVCYLDVLTLL